MPLGSSNKAIALSTPRTHLNRAEFALTRGIAILTQTVLLLGSRVLLCRDDTTVLIEYQFSLGKTSGSLIGSSVPNLGAGTFQHFVGFSVNVVLAVGASINSLNHFTKSGVIFIH